jgi:hypothetical protein
MALILGVTEFQIVLKSVPVHYTAYVSNQQIIFWYLILLFNTQGTHVNHCSYANAQLYIFWRVYSVMGPSCGFSFIRFTETLWFWFCLWYLTPLKQYFS